MQPNPGTNLDAKLPPHITLLPIVADAPLLPGLATNCFVVQRTGDVGAWVIDPPSEQSQAIDIIAAAAGDVGGVWVTHTHPDHIGGVAELVARTGARVYAHPAARPYLPEECQFVELAENAQLDGWRVLHTPGHRADSITFLEESSGIALVGDLVAGAGTVVISPPDGNLGDYLRSLHRLRDEVQPALLAPGHGPLIDEPQLLLTHYIEHRLARERKVVANLSNIPTPLDKLVPIVYDDTPPALYPLAERSLLAHLLKLAQEGRAVQTEAGWYSSEL